MPPALHILQEGSPPSPAMVLETPMIATSYFVHLDGCQPVITEGGTDHNNPRNIAAFRHDPDGSVWFEAYDDMHPICMSPSSSSRGQDSKVRIRSSAPGQERYFVLLFDDATFEIEGSVAKLRFICDNDTNTPSSLDPPDVLVENSMGPPNSNRADTQSVATMPIVPAKERGVHETPAVKARHIDPNSSLRPTLEGSPTVARQNIVEHKSGLLTGGVAAGTQDYHDVSATDSEDELLASTHFEDPATVGVEQLDSVLATQSPKDLSQLPEIINHSPSTDPMLASPITAEAKPKITTPAAHIESVDDSDRLPDSLPDAFKFKHQQKQQKHTPAKTYTKKGRGSAEKKKVPNIEVPVTRKRKGDEEGDEESPARQTSAKKRKGRDGTPISEINDESEDGIVTRKRIIRGRARPTVDDGESTPSVGEGSASGMAPEDSPSVGVRPMLREPRMSVRIDDNEDSPSASNKNDTQYTFAIDSDESEETPQPPAKTPKSKAKAPSSKKTPNMGTAAKPPITKTPISRAPAAKTPTTKRSKGFTTSRSPEPPTSICRAGEYTSSPLRIAFTNSSIPSSKSALRFLRSQSAKELSSPLEEGCNFLVVGNGELKRTPKFTVAVARGVNIVTDAWVTDSHKAGHWLKPDAYVPNDPNHEKEWGASLTEAVRRGKEGKNQVLAGKTIYLTPNLVSQLKQTNNDGPLAEMLNAAGATTIVRKLPKGEVTDDALVIGREEGDKDLGALEKAGWQVWTTALVGISVLRGELQRGDEFKARYIASGDSGKKRKGTR